MCIPCARPLFSLFPPCFPSQLLADPKIAPGGRQPPLSPQDCLPSIFFPVKVPIFRTPAFSPVLLSMTSFQFFFFPVPAHLSSAFFSASVPSPRWRPPLPSSSSTRAGPPPLRTTTPSLLPLMLLLRREGAP